MQNIKLEKKTNKAARNEKLYMPQTIVGHLIFIYFHSQMYYIYVHIFSHFHTCTSIIKEYKRRVGVCQMKM